MKYSHSFLDPLPVVVAHRGDSANYPENTMPAFLSAVKMGIDVLETDVHLTKDNQIVIWHDPSLERNTDGKGKIEDFTFDELQKFDAGYTFTKDDGKNFPFRGKGIKIAKLEDVLNECPNQRFNIDLKTKGKAIVEEFIKVVDKTNAVNRVLCASFHISNLKLMRKIRPDILTSITTIEVLKYLFKQKNKFKTKVPKNRTIVFQVPVEQWHIHVITPEFIEYFHNLGAVIQVWTINDEKEMVRLFKMGVDTIMTDSPQTVIKVAEELGLRKQ